MYHLCKDKNVKLDFHKIIKLYATQFTTQKQDQEVENKEMQKILYANTKPKQAVNSCSAYHEIKYGAKIYILEIKRKIL